tara:strand:- start:9675 stop:11111 length:1437 start_codon:yes stop_codon:yes gene_type:complete
MSSYKDEVQTSKAPSNSSQQPNILNIKSMATNQLMRYSSDVLEPLSFSQSECVFRLQPRGFLHPNSAISIGFEANATLNQAFPYITTGIHALVRRAVLRTTSGKILSDTDSWNSLEGLKSCFVQNSINKEREAMLSGRQLDYELVYDIGSDVKSTHGYGLSNGYEYCQATIAGNRQGLSCHPELRLERDPEFQLKLHNLFEYCKQGNQLPLGFLDEQIEVVLYWDFTDLKSRLCLPESLAGDIAQPISIDRTKCKFIANYTSYQGEIMDRFQEEYDKGLTFSYTDYLLSKQSVNKAGYVQNVRNVGGQGLIIDSVVYGLALDNKDATSLTGKFNSQCGSALGGVGKPARDLLTSNLFVNSEFLYPQFVSNPARQFHGLKESESQIPFIPRAIYSGQGQDALIATASGEFEGRVQRTELLGQQFYQGYRLKGLANRVDNRGIDIHNSMVIADTDHIQQCWIEVRKYVMIKNRNIEVYNM